MSAPGFDESTRYHFRVDIIPRLGPLGGHELVYYHDFVNPIRPEKAAQMLRLAAG